MHDCGKPRFLARNRTAKVGQTKVLKEFLNLYSASLKFKTGEKTYAYLYISCLIVSTKKSFVNSALGRQGVQFDY